MEPPRGAWGEPGAAGAGFNLSYRAEPKPPRKLKLLLARDHKLHSSPSPEIVCEVREFSDKPTIRIGVQYSVDHAPSVQRSLESVPVHSNNKKMGTHIHAQQAHRILTATSVAAARKQVIAHLDLELSHYCW